jgi:hypothetical protein
MARRAPLPQAHSMEPLLDEEKERKIVAEEVPALTTA